MSGSAALALQKALFSHLSGQAEMISLLGEAGILDDVGEPQGFPYVTIGEIRSSDWSTQTRKGHEHQVTLHIWSRAKGRHETQEIMGALDSALEEDLPALDGYRLVNLRPVFWHALRDPDGRTYHGVMRVRAVTEPL
ncbi:hypothetical protein FHS85_001895 [Rhodoligotrophos appendicifer]|uniref:DUF3168 domain-containing protein n=1 Tax=Rhodoligotrophos appendicifer TaxID=987056 RepID=UPI0011864817|nr:DUF3168 domain-containing protein [Rhodoligotrophos appendicifer]